MSCGGSLYSDLSKTPIYSGVKDGGTICLENNREKKREVLGFVASGKNGASDGGPEGEIKTKGTG